MHEPVVKAAADLIRAIDRGIVVCQSSCFVDSLRAAVERETASPPPTLTHGDRGEFARAIAILKGVAHV